jgi:hypothetical protein
MLSQVSDVAVRSIKPVPAPPSPPTSPVACGVVGENEVLPLGCPNGAITGVAFASFGTPTGSCPGKLARDPKCDADKSEQVVSDACVGKAGCAVKADRNAFGDPCFDVVKSLAVELKCPAGPPAPPPPAPAGPRSFVADFGRELQGGLRLSVGDGVAGTTAHIACGESIQETTVGTTWGWEFDWTLRDGVQVLEQHKYMECRWASLSFTPAAPSNFTLSGWKVHYPWDGADTAFASSNATLNAVWEISRYTLEAASLDTYTDSNTRERRPCPARVEPASSWLRVRSLLIGISPRRISLQV